MLISIVLLFCWLDCNFDLSLVDFTVIHKCMINSFSLIVGTVVYIAESSDVDTIGNTTYKVIGNKFFTIYGYIHFNKNINDTQRQAQMRLCNSTYNDIIQL